MLMICLRERGLAVEAPLPEQAEGKKRQRVSYERVESEARWQMAALVTWLDMALQHSTSPLGVSQNQNRIVQCWRGMSKTSKVKGSPHANM